ncbi:MAG: hypothetical protein U5Q44_06625 [Dehalococcoidia bacterium]|nr:hypothetical protein [Dehalococcoidia bacterium]
MPEFARRSAEAEAIRRRRRDIDEAAEPLERFLFVAGIGRCGSAPPQDVRTQRIRRVGCIQRAVPCCARRFEVSRLRRCLAKCRIDVRLEEVLGLRIRNGRQDLHGLIVLPGTVQPAAKDVCRAPLLTGTLGRCGYRLPKLFEPFAGVPLLDERNTVAGRCRRAHGRIRRGFAGSAEERRSILEAALAQRLLPVFHPLLRVGRGRDGSRNASWVLSGRPGRTSPWGKGHLQTNCRRRMPGEAQEKGVRAAPSPPGRLVCARRSPHRC